ncbi:porin [Paludibacterium yongneupense]|uniref:porin n=1 Tax=Paludibacterium yongneupense TaxID=400061 RepID=UPI0003F90A69|nr:porin [Paludibacterium yongneupense]
MKTKSITLAILAMASAGSGAAAFADDASGVTISGYIRAGVEQLNANGNAAWGLNASGTNAKSSTTNVAGRANINFNGIEDLGNGLKAEFQVNNRFSPTGSGTVDDEHTLRSGTFASHDSFVGLKSSGWGEVRLGKGTTNIDDGRYENSVVLGPDNLLGWFGNAIDNNMVRYDLPVFFGALNSSIQYSTEENKTTNYNGTSHASFDVNYDVGNWGIDADYTTTSNAVTGGSALVTGQTTAFSWASNAGTVGTLKQYHVTAQYKPISDLQFAIEFQRDSLAGNADNKTALYAYYTLGATQLGLQGGAQTFSGGGKPEKSEKFVDAFVHYSLSKQTMLYLEALYDKDGVASGSRNATIVGLQKSF